MSSIDNSSPEIHVHNPKNKIKESTGYKVFTVFNTIIMILVSFATLYPFLYLVSQSFSSEQAIIAGHTSLIPEGFNINTYIYVITRYDCEFLKYYLNTIIYTVVGTVYHSYSHLYSLIRYRSRSSGSTSSCLRSSSSRCISAAVLSQTTF